MEKICKNGQYTYILFESIVIFPDDIGIKTVYGIKIVDGCTSTMVDAISDNDAAVEKLFDLIVEGVLCPEHLANVVEDYLS